MTSARRLHQQQHRLALGFQALALIQEGKTVTVIAAALGVSRTQVYRALNDVSKTLTDPLLD